MSDCMMKMIQVCVVVICVYYCYYHCCGHHCYHSHYYHNYCHLLYDDNLRRRIILSVSICLHSPRYTVFNNLIPYFIVSYRTQSNNTRICAPREDGKMQNILRTMLHISLHRRMFRDRSVPGVSSIKNS